MLMEFTGNRLSSDGVKKILTSAQTSSLEALYLNWNAIGTEEKSFQDYLEIFNPLKNTSLITFDVSFAGIGACGVDAITSILDKTEITTLYINGNGIIFDEEQKLNIRGILLQNRYKYQEKFWNPLMHLSFTPLKI